MNAVTDVEKLKSIIIEHVAKDVLILTETVDALNEQLAQTSNMLKLLEGNTEKQFDLAAKQITDFLVAQEKHLASIADARTKQISLTVSDNVEKILIEKFDAYQQMVDKGLEKFERANVAAVESLNNDYKATADKIRKFGNVSDRSQEKGQNYVTLSILLLLSVIATGTIALVGKVIF